MHRQALHRLGEGVTDGFSVVAVGECKQHHVAGVALNQRPDGGLTLPHQKVAFPMPGYRTILHLSGTLRDHDRINNLAFAGGVSFRLRSPIGPPGA